jgi:hypothetical protein
LAVLDRLAKLNAGSSGTKAKNQMEEGMKSVVLYRSDFKRIDVFEGILQQFNLPENADTLDLEIESAKADDIPEEEEQQ